MKQAILHLLPSCRASPVGTHFPSRRTVRVAINTDVDGHPESRLRDVHHPSTGLDLQLCRSEDRSLRQKPPENQAHVGYVTGLENMVLKGVFRVRVFNFLQVFLQEYRKPKNVETLGLLKA